MLDRIEQAGGALRGEFRKHLESGAWSWTSLTVAPVKRGGSGERVVMCFIADIEEEMQRRTDQAERSQIQLLRERDQLTGLYNAATFYDKAEHLVADMPDIAYDAATSTSSTSKYTTSGMGAKQATPSCAPSPRVSGRSPVSTAA